MGSCWWWVGPRVFCSRLKLNGAISSVKNPASSSRMSLGNHATTIFFLSEFFFYQKITFIRNAFCAGVSLNIHSFIHLSENYFYQKITYIRKLLVSEKYFYQKITFYQKSTFIRKVLLSEKYFYQKSTFIRKVLRLSHKIINQIPLKNSSTIHTPKKPNYTQKNTKNPHMHASTHTLFSIHNISNFIKNWVIATMIC